MYVCKEKRPASCIVRYDTYVVRIIQYRVSCEKKSRLFCLSSLSVPLQENVICVQVSYTIIKYIIYIYYDTHYTCDDDVINTVHSASNV